MAEELDLFEAGGYGTGKIDSYGYVFEKVKQASQLAT